ncbi:MAG: DUF4082 domain-containing protein [Verrucomicrobiota bacterium]|nr:DUF4082 domain-containing protein [Verrucomicrobiota bacterium]
MKKTLLSICGAVVVCSLGFHAQANTILADSGTGPTIVGLANSNTYGYDFTVGSTPLTITALGFWDGPSDLLTPAIGDGFANVHMIGLWDISGNLLASATMQIGTVDPLLGEFRYSNLLIPTNPGPVILSANTKYVLGAGFSASDPDPFKYDVGSFQPTYDPAVSPGKSRYIGSGTGFGFPTTSASPGAFVGPNAKFNVNNVPESGSALLLMVLAIAVVFVLRGCAAKRVTRWTKF